MAGKLKPGTLVKLLDPYKLALDSCTYAIILSLHCAPDPTDKIFPNLAAYRVLCGDKTVILVEHEFEVIR
jgi:hypothetical protein